MASADPVVECIRRRGGSRADAELGEDVADVPFDRLLAQEQLGGDGLVRLAGRDQPDHLDLPRAEPGRVADQALTDQRVGTGQVRDGAEPAKTWRAASSSIAAVSSSCR